MSRELFIIRHGETDFNKRGIVQGRGVNPSLNDLGLKQAALFYKFYRNENFDVIYTSTLKRSIQSVQQFIDAGIPHEKHAALDEISWGIYEGKPSTHEFKMHYREMIQGWQSGKMNMKSEGGESPLEVQQRQLVFIEHYQKQAHQKILICMHGRAMRIFLPTLLGNSLNSMDEFPHHNLTLYKLREQNNFFAVELFNNMDHLHFDGKN